MSDASIPAFSLGRHAPVARESWFMPAGVALLATLFLGVAWWNGFPLIFYDTGAYVLEGLGGVFLVATGGQMTAAIGETPLPFSDELSRNVAIRRSRPEIRSSRSPPSSLRSA